MAKTDERFFDMTRLPPLAVRELSLVLQEGDEKYGRFDWLDKDGSSEVAAAMRHINFWLSGEDRASDSGLLHLAHAASRLLLVVEREKRGIKQGEWRIPGDLDGVDPTRS